MTQHVRSPLKRIGGKSASAERIVSLFPPASTYTRFVDTCGGAAHVLMALPSGHEEIYNDLENNLVAFWLEMQSNAAGMQAYLDTLLYSREVYYRFYRSLFDGTPLTQFERATRYFYCLRMTGTGWLRKSPVGWDHRGSNVQSFRSAIELFEQVQERFRYVAIDNRDVLDTIRRYDSPTTLFYVDSPYIGTEQYYEASKKGYPHEELARLLQNIQGMAALSYYPHPSFGEWYPAEKWRRVTWTQHKSSQIQLAAREEDTATEMLLCNYPEAKQSLWSEEAIA